MKKCVLLLVIIVSVDAFGQEDTIRKKIPEHQIIKTDLISELRNVLLDNFLKGDYQKVKETKDYLKNKLEDQDYLTLYSEEYWLILYWTREYKDLLKSIEEIDSTDVKQKITPRDDLLYNKLKEKSQQARALLQTAVKNSDIGNAEKDFLLMNLNYLLLDENYNVINQDTLNQEADVFMARYPDSRYTGFTRSYISYKLVPAVWGFGADISLGYGTYTNDLGHYFTNDFIIGFSFDVSYNNFAAFFKAFIGLGEVRNDVFYGYGTWEKGSLAELIIPEFAIGYSLINNDKLKFTPFCGIAAADIGPDQDEIDKDNYLKEAELKFTATYTAGFNLDIKFGPSPFPIASFGPEQSYWCVRLRYEFLSPQFAKKYDAFRGNIHCLTIGIDLFGRKLNRKY